MLTAQDVAIYSLAAFLGTLGVSITGFGHAIIYLFVWQIAVLSGYGSNFKFAIFIQALALFSAQAEIRKHASRRMLCYFIPITVLSTPLGQITGDRVSTDMVEAVGGVLVTFVAVFEVFQKRELFASWFCGYCRKSDNGPDDSANKKSLHEETERSSTDDSSQNDSGSDEQQPFHETYDLGKQLGEGAFSVVKEGSHKTTGNSFAVKIITKAQLFEAEEEKLQDEIARLKEVSHPNVLSLVAVYDEPEHYFLVSEKMMGGDLLTRLNGVGFFSEYETRGIIKAVVEALRYLHSHKIAHRDVKPENLLLEADNSTTGIKLADFGFAKKETSPNSFTTMCGTPAYVAPEVISGKPYGLTSDLWSLGVLAYTLIGGYQPFRGDSEDDLNREIMSGKFEFDEKFWSSASKLVKDFISGLLTVEPSMRLDAPQAHAHHWFVSKIPKSPKNVVDDTPVFFMIGSQRSGSNWLRTMLDEREDLAGPHPPHMMRDFLPIVAKYGDLSEDNNFRVVVDHMCSFVERNQVPWTDKHDMKIKFPRMAIYDAAMASLSNVQSRRVSAGVEKGLETEMYVLSVFDAIMNFYTKVNGKRIWMCKSMGMSKFHDFLLEFYGEKKLRYIYLVRDPRDVAMSFMKTPVGDCHYHAIVSKWTRLQGQALRILEECPKLVHKVHYETILKDKENTVKGVYDFIGDRRFGGVKRQASVMFMNPTKDLIDGAKKGREAQKARDLSYQFQNLGRGASFAKVQNQKWKDPKLGLNDEEIQLLESVAHEKMVKLGYQTHLVGVSTEATVFTDVELQSFDELNKKGIEAMNETLKNENPGDYQRRVHQAEALSFKPVLVEDNWTENSENSSISSSEPLFLSEEDLAKRVKIESSKVGSLENGRRFVWATGSQRGYYPQEPDKPNQDASFSYPAQRNGNYWFSVFDGHGPAGHLCAQFTAKAVPEGFAKRLADGQSMTDALTKSHLQTHEQLLAQDASAMDSRQSGTTAVTAVLSGDRCVVSNVGDSACILGCWSAGDKNNNNSAVVVAKSLSNEHTPLLEDERARIRKAGGVIMTVDQRDGLVPMNEMWNDVDAVPRIWSNEDEKFPGCGFTRSIGDSIAHTLGVTARPEITSHPIDDDSRVLIVASDGITQFMTPDECVLLACRFQGDPVQAARALIQESSHRWISQGDYMDDITATVIFFDDTNKLSRSDADGSEDDNNNTNDLIMDPELGIGTKQAVVAVSTDTEITDDASPLGRKAQFWTVAAGAASGFLGGLSGIRGPPIIFYFLHPPHPVAFTKESQRATGACVTATNVAMRVIFYLIDTLALDGANFFTTSDWGLYLSVILCSCMGVFVGSYVFERVKDSKATIRGILAIFLLLCGISLLLSSYAGL